jgi:hypothetical protein
VREVKIKMHINLFGLEPCQKSLRTLGSYYTYTYIFKVMTINRFIKIKDMKNNKEFNFTEGWLSGFTQSDGCFTVVFDKRSSGLMLRPKPIFMCAI